jgi:hypothetical protein
VLTEIKEKGAVVPSACSWSENKDDGKAITEVCVGSVEGDSKKKPVMVTLVTRKNGKITNTEVLYFENSTSKLTYVGTVNPQANDGYYGNIKSLTKKSSKSYTKGTFQLDSNMVPKLSVSGEDGTLEFSGSALSVIATTL